MNLTGIRIQAIHRVNTGCNVPETPAPWNPGSKQPLPLISTRRYPELTGRLGEDPLEIASKFRSRLTSFWVKRLTAQCHRHLYRFDKIKSEKKFAPRTKGIISDT
jgi:hypothetical protein